jgi:hypothetical protein
MAPTGNSKREGEPIQAGLRGRGALDDPEKHDHRTK